MKIEVYAPFGDFLARQKWPFFYFLTQILCQKIVFATPKIGVREGIFWHENSHFLAQNLRQKIIFAPIFRHKKGTKLPIFHHFHICSQMGDLR